MPSAVSNLRTFTSLNPRPACEILRLLASQAPTDLLYVHMLIDLRRILALDPGTNVTTQEVERLGHMKPALQRLVLDRRSGLRVAALLLLISVVLTIAVLAFGGLRSRHLLMVGLPLEGTLLAAGFSWVGAKSWDPRSNWPSDDRGRARRSPRTQYLDLRA